MKRWIARAGLLALLAVAALAGCSKKESGTNEVAAPAAAGTPRRIGPFQVSVANRPGRPVVGDNILRVAVRDSAGLPLRGATLTALVSMPAMGAMPRMRSEERRVGKECRSRWSPY